MKKIIFLSLTITLFSIALTGQVKTGTLKVFCEIEGVSVYLDDVKQEKFQEIPNVTVGTHYLKALKDGVNVFGELITINEGQTTTILIKNTGQVNEKIINSKIKEQEEYTNSRLDVLFTSKSITQTTGSSTLFPGYYGYWGYSNSVSSTSQISDFKIVQGGVKEIGDLALAKLAGNTAILEQNAKDNVRSLKLSKTGVPLFLAGILSTLVFLGDFILDEPFLHKSPEHPDWEVYAATGSIAIGITGFVLMEKSNKVYPDHYYQVDEAARDAQDYNRKLKQKLGLPENYDKLK